MRFFVQTFDGEIIEPTNLFKSNEGELYFKIGNDLFRYKCSGKLYPFEIFTIANDWVYTTRIKRLYELHEEENEELNYFESTDFNAGYIYARMEKSVVKHMIKEGSRDIHCSIDIPKIQMVLDTYDFDAYKVIKTTLDTVKAHFNAVYGKTYSLDELTWHKSSQYICVNYKITKKEQPKELTVADIEKLLGYKIKIVGENNENN